MATPVSCHHPGRVRDPYDSDVSRALFPTLLAAVLAGRAVRRRRHRGLHARRPRRTPADTAPTQSTRHRPATATTDRSRSPAGHQSARRPGRRSRRTGRCRPPAADGSRQHLLTAARLPALGDDLAWTVVGTDAEAPEPDRRLPEDLARRHRRGARRTPRLRRPGRLRRRGAPSRSSRKFARRRRRPGAPSRCCAPGATTARQRLDYPRKDGRPAGRRSPTAEPAASPGTTASPTAPAARSDAAGTGIVAHAAPWLTIVEITGRPATIYPDASGTPPAAPYAGSRPPCAGLDGRPDLGQAQSAERLGMGTPRRESGVPDRERLTARGRS